MSKLLAKALEHGDQWVSVKSDKSGTDNFARFKHITEDPLAHDNSVVTSRSSAKRSFAAGSSEARPAKRERN